MVDEAAYQLDLLKSRVTDKASKVCVCGKDAILITYDGCIVETNDVELFHGPPDTLRVRDHVSGADDVVIDNMLPNTIYCLCT